MDIPGNAKSLVPSSTEGFFTASYLCLRPLISRLPDVDPQISTHNLARVLKPDEL
jgi:hypothetical protein